MTSRRSPNLSKNKRIVFCICFYLRNLQGFISTIENASGLEATTLGVWETPTRRFPVFEQNQIDDFPSDLNIGLTFSPVCLMTDRRFPYKF